MSEDRLDGEVEALLTGALPVMGADWREQAVAAVQATRPARRLLPLFSPPLWKLAAAAAVIAMLLPLLGVPAWKQLDAARWRHQVAHFQNPAATTPEGRGIATVHYVEEVALPQDDEDPWRTDTVIDMRVKFPDKQHGEESVIGADDASVFTREGDRELAQSDGGYSEGEGMEVYNCALDWAMLPFISPDAFTETGVRQAGYVATEWDPVRSWAFGAEQNTFEQREETGPNGELIIVTDHRKPGFPDFHGVYRTSIDPATRLVTGWDYQVTGLRSLPHPHADAEGYRLNDGMRLIVAQVTYNEQMPDALFSTEPPEGATVLDRYSPEGIKRYYELTVERMERSYAGSEDPEQWAKSADYISRERPGRFAHLDLLSEEDQADLRARLHAIGIEVP